MKKAKLDFYPKCSASAIGSLPFISPQEAVEAVFGAGLEIPFWPQLPKRDFREGMLFQFIENLSFLNIKDKSIVLSDGYNRNLEHVFEAIIKKDLDFFSISNEYAAGLVEFLDYLKKKNPDVEFIKGQITGPFTLASQIKAPDGNSLLFDAQLLDAVISGLAMKAAWQIREFKRLKRRGIIFIDEPYLACFGSGFTPVNRKDVVEIINRLIQTIEEPECLIGLHCCSNTDWSLLLETDIDIISFDAFSYFERFSLYPRELKDFLGKGGAIAWGIVPTSEFNSNISSEDLVAKFEEGLTSLEAKGLDKKELINSSLITPSCGMGSLSGGDCELILKLLCQTSRRLKERFSLS
ncbi:MAG: hypothetical protein ABIE81_01630 [Candidatus Omnitrophota bacterium]